MTRNAIWLLAAGWFVLSSPPVAGSDAAPPTDEPPSRRAYQLGEFAIQDYRPVEHEKVKLQLTVYVEVAAGQHEQFEKLWASREHRVRSQVITAARLVPAEEYDDPTLHALRRRIYLRLRRAVPELPIEQVFVSDFSYLRD